MEFIDLVEFCKDITRLIANTSFSDVARKSLKKKYNPMITFTRLKMPYVWIIL